MGKRITSGKEFGILKQRRQPGKCGMVNTLENYRVVK